MGNAVAAESAKRSSAKNRRAAARLPGVDDVLAAPGHPLDGHTRDFMQARLAHDFSRVRVHADSGAASSARSVNALAYAVRQHVVFGAGQYAPHTDHGRRLLAHELVHVVQQSAHTSGGGAVPRLGGDSSLEAEAQRLGHHAGDARTGGPVRVTQRSAGAFLGRADPAAVGRVMRRGTTFGSGLQFWPTQVTDTRVGPVSGVGGLLEDQTSNRLSVIVGANVTPRSLARQLLPLWTTATPFTAPGAAASVPLDVITEDVLARGLLVYNQQYLPLPAMTQWRAGLRFPLPVEIDEATGVATVHPTIVRQLNGAFDAAWQPLLDLAAGATQAPAAADLDRQATTFLASETTALGRGIGLGARAITNAVAGRPLVVEVFHRLAAGAFDVALALMDSLVNRQVELLASQRDGAAILDAVRQALAAAPATLTEAQRASSERATRMLARGAAIAPRDPAAGACANPGRARSMSVQPVFFRTGAADTAPTGHSFPGRLRTSQTIWSKVGVQISQRTAITIDDAVNKTAGGTDAELTRIAALRTADGVEVFVVENDIAHQGGAFTFFPFGPDAKTVLSDRGSSSTLLAHELGHVLGLNHPGAGTTSDGDADTIMQPTGSHSIANRPRNTIVNFRRMTWPQGGATCLRPDP